MNDKNPYEVSQDKIVNSWKNVGNIPKLSKKKKKKNEKERNKNK